MSTFIPGREAERCGRPTKRDTPCKMPQMAIVGWYANLSHRTATCTWHATKEELADFKAIAATIKAEDERQRLAYHQARPVKCWEWPVTDEHRRRAAEARMCPDPDRAYDLAWELLADWQDDRCAISGGYADRLDHDHKTGLVRGWLCHNCNVSEGHSDIPGGRFERYRAKNPASILGISIRYYSPFTGWAEPLAAVDLLRGSRSGTILSDRRKKAKAERDAQ